MQDFDAQLRAVLTREVQGFQSLLACEQLSAGASQETYRISYHSDQGEQCLALRRAQPTAADGAALGGVTLEQEAQLFQLARANGVPGPEVIYVLRESDAMGSGFLMQWLEGETLGQRIVRDEQFDRIRPQLAYQCGEILGRLHQIPVSENFAAQLPRVDVTTLVDETWEYYRALAIPVPMIDYCWRWLKAKLPRQSRSTLVHGDFRNGNLMISPEGVSAVLDWELAHIGDPVRDLGWLCVNSWRFGKSDLPVGGFGRVNDLLAGYAAVTGMEVQPSELHFWQVFGSFWWSMATLQMAGAWRSGETPSLERPVIGRRSTEAQMDCVNLLIPGSFDLPEEKKSLSAGTQLPMPAELLQGVREFLKNDVPAKLESHDAFLAIVAANSLGIAQRELLYAAELATAERHRLQSILKSKDDLDTLRWQLVEQLRGDLPLDTPGLAQHLRQTVAGQLFIDQPRYSALQA